MKLPHLLLILCVVASAAFAADPVPVELPGIHNAFQATDRLISGSQPEGDSSFAALAKAGVKTIISVDGGKPDVAGAKKHGLRYIHLPFGYDGIPAARIPELTKAAQDAADGKIFVHCHHGKHRGPAAVGVICEATEGWTPARAEEWLKKAGTAPDYPGLFRAVRDFAAPTKEQLAKIGPLPEVSQTGDLIDAMVAIDDHFMALKDSQKNGWKAPAGNPDATPAHQATLLWEQFRELARTPDTAKRSDDYRKHLADSEKAADILRTALKANVPDPVALEAAFKSATQSCSACHKAFRNQKK
jgi:protein tyrosine phosphatase (PTP) superfamily phosphohydrolase (DUF442 family)/cytochrome c556